MGPKSIAAALFALAVAVGCEDLPDAPIAGKDDERPRSSPPESQVHEGLESIQDQIRELYEKARRSGEDVPADAYEWARGDIEKIGDWEYRILRVARGDDAALEAQLNELGTERWEAFWIDPRPDGLWVVLKRPVRTYLRHIPFSELRHLIPGGGE